MALDTAGAWFLHRHQCAVAADRRRRGAGPARRATPHCLSLIETQPIRKVRCASRTMLERIGNSSVAGVQQDAFPFWPRRRECVTC